MPRIAKNALKRRYWENVAPLPLLGSLQGELRHILKAVAREEASASWICKQGASNLAQSPAASTVPRASRRPLPIWPFSSDNVSLPWLKALTLWW